MLDRLIIHAGMEKTGTTSIQRRLADQRAALHRQGFLYPANFDDHGGPQIPLTASCIDFSAKSPVLALLGLTTPGAHEAHKVRVQHELATQLEGSVCHTGIISDEHLSVHASSPEMLARLPRMFGIEPGRVTPVIYFRRQDRMLEAMLSEALKSLSTRFYDLDNPGASVAHRAIRFDYSRILGNLTSAFGRGRMVVGSAGCQGGEDAVSRFAADAGVPIAAHVMRLQQNASVPGRLMRPLWKLARQIDTAQAGGLRAEWRGLVDRLMLRFPGDPFRLQRQSAQAFLDRFAEENDRLVASFPGLETAFNRDGIGAEGVEPVSQEEILAAAADFLSPAVFEELAGLMNETA